MKLADYRIAYCVLRPCFQYSTEPVVLLGLGKTFDITDNLSRSKAAAAAGCDDDDDDNEEEEECCLFFSCACHNHVVVDHARQ